MTQCQEQNSRNIKPTIVHAFITCRLDYCNGLFYGLPNTILKKLQGIQNAAARLVVSARKFDHLTPIYRELHWLPVNKRIEFELLLLTYKALKGLSPSYISSLIQTCVNTRYSLRSGAALCLNVPKSKLVICGDRAFSVAAPKLWTALPHDVRISPSLEAFKKNLATHFFLNVYR